MRTPEGSPQNECLSPPPSILGSGPHSLTEYETYHGGRMGEHGRNDSHVGEDSSITSVSKVPFFTWAELSPCLLFP